MMGSLSILPGTRWETLGRQVLCNGVSAIKHLLANPSWFLTLGISHTFAGDSKLVMKSYL